MARRIEIRAPAHTAKCTAVLSYWYKRVGEPVRAGEDLLDYETDKATITMEAPADGVLAAIVVPEDGTVEPSMLLGYLETHGEEADDAARS